MKTVNTAKFMAHQPHQFDTISNLLGQEVVFFEHPLNGDEDFIYACIEGVMFSTGFLDMDDFYTSSDYMPVLIKGVPMCTCEGMSWSVEKGTFTTIKGA